MCFNPLAALMPKAPSLTPLPSPPSNNDAAVRLRMQLENEKLAATNGTASTVKTDLDPKSLVGDKKVLLGA